MACRMTIPKRFHEYDQDELRRAMLRGPVEEPEGVTQAEVYWMDVKRLLTKHKRLTTGDIATLTGRSETSIKASMRAKQRIGKVRGRKLMGHRIVEWVLV